MDIIVNFVIWAYAQNQTVGLLLAGGLATAAWLAVSAAIWALVKLTGAFLALVGAGTRQDARAQAPRRMTAAEQAALTSGQVKPVSDRDMAELRAAAQALADLQNNRLQAVSPAQQRAAQERYASALKRVQR